MWAQHEAETIERIIKEERAKWQLIIQQKDDELIKSKKVNIDELLKVRLV
jgi:hypothetical protein